MRDLKCFVALLLTILLFIPTAMFASSHREAPITALDHKADITDLFAFVSYDKPGYVTFIMNVDPFLEPSNGPNYFPFSPDLLYSIKIDNTYDAIEDITFEFRFNTEIRAPEVFTGFVGAGAGIGGLIPPAITALDGPGSDGLSLRQTYTVTMIQNCPAGTVGTATGTGPIGGTPGTGGTTPGPTLQSTCAAPAGTGTGTTPGGQAFSTSPGLRYSFSTSGTGQKLVAVPSFVGPRTMPNYKPDLTKVNPATPCPSPATKSDPLVCQGIYDLGNGIRVFAGTVDDPFYIDVGAIFDSLNLRQGSFFGATGLLTQLQDINNEGQGGSPVAGGALGNTAPDALSGFNVNTIAIEVPISMVTQGNIPTIGVWATTARAQTTIRRPDLSSSGLGQGFTTTSGGTAPGGTTTTPPQVPSPNSSGPFVQVQRMAHPLFNELIIGTGFKDTWSMSYPKDDAQFARFALNPLVAKVLGTVFSVPVPDAPRLDLLPLVQYLPPIAAAGVPKGPVADLLRLNTAIGPTVASQRKRLGVLAGDLAGYPNGRRVSDDVTDVAMRVVAGALCNAVIAGAQNAPCTVSGAAYTGAQVQRLGDGVNMNDVTYLETFPYVGFAHSGRDRVHINPGGPGCAGGVNCPSGQ